ncbi:MAG: MBL fold metallo-hydrolase [Myxococcota bacterium]|nr:MBL fold metallo-hydrolase [Myxococcota bacterium]
MSVFVEFVGAAQTVTGSRHLVHTHQSTVLLDCGMYQGRRAEARQRNEQLGFDPASLQAVVLSHAHIDHSGALPLLCKHGYQGPIYATPATRDLCAVMLEDAAMIQASDARYLNRAIERDHLDAQPITPLYGQQDVARVLEQMISIPYHRTEQVAAGVKVTFHDAGHVLGSAVVALDLDDHGQNKRLVYTGDLGRHQMPILRDPEVPSGAEALLIESTYGDRLHPPIQEMDEQLAAVIHRTHQRGGKVLIPSFALERAQEVIYSLKKLRTQKRIPPLPVYVDSPLTVNITDIFRLHPECYDAEAARLVQQADSPFEFPGLRYVSEVEDSMALDASEEPCVIISASGMCEGGRILHHLKAAMEDRKNTVLIVGFQAQHTLGRRIVERRPRVRLFGVERDLNAEVVILNGFSAHADQGDLISFTEKLRERGKLRHIALVHGEKPAQDKLRTLLTERGFPDVRIPAPGQKLEF